ncbi:MAG: hypothetical protein WEB09_08960 [Nitriliruptor sp.]
MEATTRRCPRCEQRLPLDAFGWRDAEHRRRQSFCRPCEREAWRTWYAKSENRARHLAQLRERRARRRAELVAMVREFKARPCADCGRRYPPEVMDLDHVRGDKLGDLSRLVHTAGRRTVVDELTKCDVVCANCHRQRTATRRAAGSG